MVKLVQPTLLYIQESIATKSLHDQQVLQEQLLNQEKEKLKQQIHEMQAKISNHQSNRTSIQAECEKIKEDSRSLRDLIDTLSSELCEKDREINSLKEELELHGDKFQQDADFRQIIRRMEEKAEQREKELVLARKQLESIILQSSQMEAIKESATTDDAIPVQLRSDLQAFEGNSLEAMSTQSRLKEEIELLKASQGVGNQPKLEVDKEKAIEELVVENMSLKAGILALESKVQSTEKDRLEELRAVRLENTKCTKQLANMKAHLIEVLAIISNIIDS